MIPRFQHKSPSSIYPPNSLEKNFNKKPFFLLDLNDSLLYQSKVDRQIPTWLGLDLGCIGKFFVRNKSLCLVSKIGLRIFSTSIELKKF